MNQCVNISRHIAVYLFSNGPTSTRDNLNWLRATGQNKKQPTNDARIFNRFMLFPPHFLFPSMSRVYFSNDSIYIHSDWLMMNLRLTFLAFLVELLATTTKKKNDSKHRIYFVIAVSVAIIRIISIVKQFEYRPVEWRAIHTLYHTTTEAMCVVFCFVFIWLISKFFFREWVKKFMSLGHIKSKWDA